MRSRFSPSKPASLSQLAVRFLVASSANGTITAGPLLPHRCAPGPQGDALSGCRRLCSVQHRHMDCRQRIIFHVGPCSSKRFHDRSRHALLVVISITHVRRVPQDSQARVGRKYSNIVIVEDSWRTESFQVQDVRKCHPCAEAIQNIPDISASAWQPRLVKCLEPHVMDRSGAFQAKLARRNKNVQCLLRGRSIKFSSANSTGSSSKFRRYLIINLSV